MQSVKRDSEKVNIRSKQKVQTYSPGQFFEQ